jgi:hypothetical protein
MLLKQSLDCKEAKNDQIDTYRDSTLPCKNHEISQFVDCLFNNNRLL